EYKSLMDNNTWVLVPRPRGRKILSNRWVFVVKYTGTGHIDRFKARLVIKGFLQEYGIDYNEIFSPVIRMEVLRLLLTIAALLDFEIHQMDVKTVFLNGTLEEEIYMAQPEGFKVPGKEHLVCKLLRSLYGLKQA
uniref:Reverse transcriptase Ty1/copia-type domain-containing protein n=1 Tax=Phytophthora ramorum TaxID=164328 RepID=H3G5D2_PHYRM